MDRRVPYGRPYLTASGALRGRVGIVCPQCGASLRIIQTRLKIFRAFAWILLLASLWSFGSWIRGAHAPLAHTISIIVAILTVAWIGILERVFTPRLAEVRVASPVEDLIFPLRAAYEGTAPDDGDTGDRMNRDAPSIHDP
jgi:hypothetical protein